MVGRREQALRGSYRLRADVLDENGQLALSYYKHADPSYSKASRFQSAFDLHTDILRGFPIGTVNGLRVGVLICHDIIYPALAAQYAGRIDLLVTISGASVDARKWMTFVAARARELQVPATHVCAHGPDRTVPGSLALVSPCLTILAETSDLNDYNAPRTFRDKTTYVLADYAGAHRSLEPFLSVNDRGIRPNAGQVIRFQGSRRIIPVDSAILESGLSFQQIVSCHLGKPFLYLYSSHSPIAMPTIRARAIENVVPIAIARDGQYLVLNPTLYRQCSSYTVRDFARVDEMRQSATSLFKRIPAEPYKRLLSMGQRNLASYTSAP